MIYEEALAALVMFVRSDCICPHHEHVEVANLTKEGGALWIGPWCEVPELAALAAEDGVYCEFHQRRDEILDIIYNLLGTRDMTSFFP